MLNVFQSYYSSQSKRSIKSRARSQRRSSSKKSNISASQSSRKSSPRLQFVPPQKKLMPMILKHNFSQRKHIKKIARASRVQSPDWAGSYLDQCVTDKLTKFNWQRNCTLLSESEIHSVLSPILSRENISKAQNTIKQLSSELLFNTHAKHYPSYTLSQKSLFRILRQLFDARKITIKILLLIHRKKSLDSESLLPNEYTHSLKQIQEDISRLISNWQSLNVPYSHFIYDKEYFR